MGHPVRHQQYTKPPFEKSTRAWLSTAIVLIAAGCQTRAIDPVESKTSARARQGLANDPPTLTGASIVSIQDGQAPIPSSPPIFIIDAADFAAHLDTGVWNEATTTDKINAVALAETGQSPDALGVFGVKSTSCGGSCTLDVRVVLVANDPKLFTSGGVSWVQTTNYFVAAIKGDVDVGWYATAVGFSFKQNTAGLAGSRCCDRGQRCTVTNLAPGGGGCSPSPYVYCDGWLSAGELPSGTDTTSQRTAVGLPVISAKLFPASTSAYPSAALNMECLPAPGGSSISSVAPPGCGVSLAVCSPEAVAVQPPERFWTAALDGTGCLAGTTRPVSGRVVPKGCQYASAMAVPSGCAGHCESCESWASTWDSYGQGTHLPPMCAVAKVDSANSSICLRNPERDAQIAAFNNEMLARTSNCHDNTGNCCGEGCVCEASGPSGSRMCQQCDGTSCHQIVLPPRYDPYAEDGPAAPATGTCTVGPCADDYVYCDGTTCVSGVPTAPAPASAETVPATNTSPQKTTVGGAARPTIPPRDAKDDRPQTRAAATQPANKSVESPDKEDEHDPISLLSGSLDYSNTDLAYPGPVHPLTFTRFYSSASPGRSPLGSNWTHNWDVHLELLREGTAPPWALPYCASTSTEDIRCVLYHAADGSTRLFYFDEKTRLYMPQAGSTDTVMRVFNYPWGSGAAEGIEATHWALRSAHGDILTFDLQGYLTDVRDRFGNGFHVTQEDTPFYTLWKDCKAWVADHSTIPQGCRLLDTLTGQKALSNERIAPEIPAGFALSIGTHPQDEAYFNALFSTTPTLGRSAFGIRLKRPIEVEDDLGRKLTFLYSTPTSSTWKTYSPSAAWAHLLVEVRGPAGGKVRFDYDRPAADKLPADFNESFLTSASRQDTSSSAADVAPAAARTIVYTYDWSATISGITFATSNPLGVTGTVYDAYRDYFASFIGCNGMFKEQCGNLVRPWLNNLDPAELARTSVFNIASDVWDNIVSVRIEGTLESATRYETSPASLDFDKAREQRYGSKQWEAPASGPTPPTSGYSWTSEEAQLPLGTLTYVEGGPVAEPTSLGAHTDRTEGVLPGAIAARYALEATPGGGLPDESPLDLGHSASNGKPKCAPGMTEALGRALPGHAPSYPYFAPPGFTGTFDPDAALLRSRHTCGQLAERQLANPFHNDTLSIVDPAYAAVGAGTTLPGGGYRDISRHWATRFTGERDAVAQDANRICQWTAVVDRDGNKTWFGLNFQGQPLVEAAALRSAPTTFRYVERKFNADGSLLQETRPTVGAAVGVARFEYEEIRPEGNSGSNDNLPAWWTRRQNLTRRTDSVNAAVSVESESSPGTFASVAALYTAFRYEPIYNQLLTAESGTIPPGTGVSPTWHQRMSWLQDYQELEASDSGLGPVLDALRPWGFGWATTTGGAYDYSAINAWQLPLVFHGADLNGDGWVGFPRLATTGTSRAKGVPIQIIREVPGTSVMQHEVIQWNSAGQPSRYRDELGNDTQWSYYPLKNAGVGVYGTGTAPTSADASFAEAGFLASMRTRRGPSAEAFAGFGLSGCPDLRGPYQYLLPSGCRDTAAELAALGLPASTVTAILAASNDQAGAFAERGFSYSETGRVRYAWNDGQRTHSTTDVDGRPQDVTTPDAVVTHHAYSALGLIETTRSAPGELLYRSKYKRDDAGRLLASCVETVAGACAAFPTTLRPANAVVQEATFTPAGRARRAIGPALAHSEYTYDERGLVTGVLVHAPSDPGFEGRRQLMSYDHDGNLVSEWSGANTSGTTPLVARSWARDSFGRPWLHHDGRVTWNMNYSARGLLTEVREANNSAWTVRPQWNALGLEVGRKLNGVLVSETLRTPGGLAVGARGWGQTAWEYFATGSSGEVLWHRAPDGNQDAAVFDASAREVHAIDLPNNAGALVGVSSLDTMGRTVAVTQHGGAQQRTATIERNAAGFIHQTTDVNGFQTRHTRNLLGWDLLVETQRGTGGFATESYANHTGLGLPTLVTDAKGEEISYGFSPIGERTSQTGPGAAARAWGYDRVSRLKTAGRLTQQPGASIVYDYDGLDLQSITADGVTHTTFEYDVLGRPVTGIETNPGLANLLAASDREVKTTLEYDNLGRTLLQIQKVGGYPTRQVKTDWRLHASGYAEMVRETPNSIWGHTEWLETYDVSGRLASRSRTGGGTAANQQFFYSGNRYSGREQHSGLGGSPLRQSIGFDAFRQTSESTYRAVDLDRYNLPVDANEGDAYCQSGYFYSGWDAECARPAFREELLRGADGRAYSWKSIHGFPSAMGGQRTAWMGSYYGAAGELARNYEEWLPAGGPTTTTLTLGLPIAAGDVDALGAQVSADAWTYDRDWRVGSLTKASHPSRGTRQRIHGRSSGYRLDGLDLGTSSYPSGYDDDGAATEIAGRTLQWGPSGELVKTVSPGGTEYYLYDAFGRLAASHDGSQVKQTYSWDGQQMVASFNGSGASIWEATWGPGVDNLIEFRRFEATSATDYAVITDQRHSVVAAMNFATRASENVFTYTPEGLPSGRDVNDDSVCDEALGYACTFPAGMPFGFNSAFRSETTGLIYMRNRWYSPQAGEFLSHDPLGPVDSFNLYVFAAFDPLNGWDPFGLEAREHEAEARRAAYSPKYSPFEITRDFGWRWGAVSYLKRAEGRVANAQWFLIEHGPLVVQVSGLLAQATSMGIGMGMGGGLPGAPSMGLVGGPVAVAPAIPLAVPVTIPVVAMAGSGTSGSSQGSSNNAPSDGASARDEGQTLNLGSGSNPMEGAINLDKRAGAGVNVRADANNLPFADGSMKEVHSINPYKYNPVSPETARVMEPGGLLKVTGNPANEFAQPVTPQAAQSAGFELIETTPQIEAHSFGTQRRTSGTPLNTQNSTTTVYRKLP